MVFILSETECIDIGLTSSSAELDAFDPDERTPLSQAIERGDAQASSLLLQFGASQRICFYCGIFPLHASVCAIEPDCMLLLLPPKTDTDASTNWIQSLLHHAAAYNNDTRRTQVVLLAGADFRLPRPDGITTPRIVSIIRHHGSGNDSLEAWHQRGQARPQRRHRLGAKRSSQLPRISPCALGSRCFSKRSATTRWKYTPRHCKARRSADDDAPGPIGLSWSGQRSRERGWTESCRCFLGLSRWSDGALACSWYFTWAI